MKRLLIAIVLVGWLLLLGYATFRSSLSTSPVKAEATVTPLIPGPKPTPRVPPDKTYYRKRCWPACHYDSAWISEEPPQETLDFEGALGSGWEWVNEDSSYWSLTEAPGALRIVSQGGSLIEGEGLEGAKNVLTREAPAGYFDLITRVTFEPTVSSQGAAIFIELDKGSVVSLGRGYCEEGDGDSCTGQAVYFDGTSLGCERFSVPVLEGTVNLMLRKAGNSYVGYYCQGKDIEPEADWVEVGRCYSPGSAPNHVGLAATNGEDSADVPETPADFDLISLVERE